MNDSTTNQCPASSWCTFEDQQHDEHYGQTLQIPASGHHGDWVADETNGGFRIPSVAVYLEQNPYQTQPAIGLLISRPGKGESGLSLTQGEASRLRDNLTRLLTEAAQ